jgi:hypothetical protein
VDFIPQVAPLLIKPFARARREPATWRLIL